MRKSPGDIAIPEYNLESGMPSLETASKELQELLQREKKRRTPVIKIIHGYGSSGAGGKLRAGLRRQLEARRAAGRLKALIYGEDFSLAKTGDLLKDYPDLVFDPDFNQGNPGVTIIIL